MANLLYYKKFNPIGFSKPITDIFLQEDAFNHILIRLIGEQDAFFASEEASLLLRPCGSGFTKD
jgi:hypothetical protein